MVQGSFIREGVAQKLDKRGRFAKVSAHLLKFFIDSLKSSHVFLGVAYVIEFEG